MWINQRIYAYRSSGLVSGREQKLEKRKARNHAGTPPLGRSLWISACGGYRRRHRAKFCDSQFRGFRFLVPPIFAIFHRLIWSPFNSVNTTVLCDVIGQPRYECLCDAGWTKSQNGPMCNVDVDECHSESRPPCSTNPLVQCINTPGSFTCGPCPAGLQKTFDTEQQISNIIVTDNFSGRIEQSFGCVCLSVCPNNNVWTKWPTLCWKRR